MLLNTVGQPQLMQQMLKGLPHDRDRRQALVERPLSQWPVIALDAVAMCAVTRHLRVV